ncbi:MAG TPA: Asp-tRNA(Asn)/Glu-tRNA(Gln) amidotransferase subunit GatC [Bacteroidota bacterium]|nr:Asp-tRNA(Asn)/Glu-tRNA(Gln) amidotransferase subunit GatC [Bacteroidota bacterium]
MSVTIKDVDHIAQLARLEFPESEKETLTHQMNDILLHIEKLNELDTANVEPLSHVIELENVFREDEARPSLSADEALKNAPSRVDDFFTVPKVIG